MKHDVETGTETFWHAPEGTFVSETVVAPKLGSTAEDDAYLLTFSCDMVNDESHCEIFDAADPTGGPIARVKLPERISSGTHATWAPASPAGPEPPSRRPVRARRWRGEEVAFGDVSGGLTTFALEPDGAVGVGRKVLDPLGIATHGRDVDAITDPRGDERDFACLAAFSAGGLDHDDADTDRQG